MRLATVVCLVIVVLLISGSESAVSRGIFKDPAHPGKCVVAGLVLVKGQIARHPQRCERIICGDNSQAEFHSCGAYGIPPGKKFGKYTAPNADYPACCDREIINA
ncbi:uncharacterized protein LOC108113184 [Drosophila eugracilis]|uniref:uncharacterized protein LOC108113184 n=1 Tax=Drosophila eugracilis TaxID=29029 RepID=UPI0007E5ECE1|nr:uncharacterized protein LOC108113184 [Drosophila eugracilis]